MQRLLILGTDSVVGANFAASLSCSDNSSGATEVTGVPLHDLPADAAGIHDLIAEADPTHIIYAGEASRSCWEGDFNVTHASLEDERLGLLLPALAASDAHVTYFSSDAIFGGPYLFHAEQDKPSEGCPAAQTLVEWESRVQAECDSALILRTHAVGWSPDGSGLIENWLDDLAARRGGNFDPLRHATPILATDVLPIWSRACDEGLSGVWHVAGAERVNPVRFARLLAAEFDAPVPLTIGGQLLDEPRTGYGLGETSLQTRAIRKALCVAMPTLSETVRTLKEQSDSGHREAVQTTETSVIARAA